MKILAIRGKNLASLEGEFEVDFTAEPLKSAGIFAITGSTGSGKSTLLDAICLALFNDTPRINSAVDNAEIADVNGKTIKQKSTSTILRRGTADGYAEVDFIALNGDRICARWSVRRLRDKIDGSLKGSGYSVLNLSTNSELQGGKTELLKKVRELIGLTFDQFTRSVLLAQGDFATFLKAGKNEKAELLEKLTGTDIYSRISAKIYENTKEAETELGLITTRIKDVEILTPEQIAELVAEQKTAISEITKFDSELDILSKKIEWLKTDEQLKASLSTAQKDVAQNDIAVDQAKTRFDYIARVDSVQDIRDDFKQLSNDRKRLDSAKIALKEQEDAHKINLKALGAESETLNEYQKEQHSLNEQWQEIEPQIKEARKLDVQIEGATEKRAEAEKDLAQFVAQKSKCEKAIPTLEAKIDSINKSQNEISTWFETNKMYSDIVTRIDVLSTYINDSYDLQESLMAKKKEVEISKEALNKDKEQLETQKAEEVRLNNILPTEIADLRAQLVDNEPCPVCGSEHHPISTINIDSLEQEALNSAKEIVAKNIERLTQSIIHENEQLARSDSSILSYTVQYDKLVKKITESLINIPQWQEKYATKTLDSELKEIEKHWQNNVSQQTSLKEQFNEQKQNLKVEKDKLEELTNTVSDKEKLQLDINNELSKLKETRKSLLKGADTDSVENDIKNRLKVSSDKIIAVTAHRDLLSAKCEKASGEIAQIGSGITNLTASTSSLDNKVILWLSKRDDKITVEELTTLLSNDNSWLLTERQSLELLLKSKLSAQATLMERQRKVNEHSSLLIKPTESDTEESLTDTQTTQKDKYKTTSERKTEIGVALANHEKGKERIKQFEKEIEQKRAVAENWRKLNDLFGSADGAKFKVLAQGYTLDVLLGYANKHLKDISQRYVLERVSTESLSLQVVDLDMLSEVRSVHSLSGGESFLISLALALGLSSLSSNRMRVESLFIDEGFGTLDAEALRIAMNALESLQTQGRKIGVISHVTEMTERISTKIQVVKTTNGRSHIEVV